MARYRAKGRLWLIQTMWLEGMNLIDRARDGECRGAIMMHCSQELAMELHHLGLKVVLVTVV